MTVVSLQYRLSGSVENCGGGAVESIWKKKGYIITKSEQFGSLKVHSGIQVDEFQNS